ncbi:MAG: hypothetical protein K8S24_06110 [Candidatus Aegiribacteria sp.]|nr:hypothetical protein [Candidatus Aegiribacteria sp.]
MRLYPRLAGTQNHFATSRHLTLARVLLLSAILLLHSSISAAPVYTSHDFWLMASGHGLLNYSTDESVISETFLLSQLKNGNTKALIPLVHLLVASGRTDYAEIWMEGRGNIMPVSRRDLGIALSWYGRYDLHSVMTSDIPIPPDLQNDDYAYTIAAILYLGWMNSSQDGCFYPDLLVGPTDLDLLADDFFPSSYSWERDWISMSSLDSLFAAGISEGSGQ